MSEAKVSIRKSLLRYNASPVRYLPLETREKYLKCANDFSGDPDPTNNILSTLILRTQYPIRKYRYLTDVEAIQRLVNQDLEIQAYVIKCKEGDVVEPTGSISILDMVKYLVEFSPVYLDIFIVGGSEEDIVTDEIRQYLLKSWKKSNTVYDTFEFFNGWGPSVNNDSTSLDIESKKNMLIFVSSNKSWDIEINFLVNRGFETLERYNHISNSIINISQFSQPFFEDQEVFRINDLEFALETRGQYRPLFLTYEALKLYDASYISKLPEDEREDWYNSVRDVIKNKEGNLTLSRLILNNLEKVKTPKLLSGPYRVTLYSINRENFEWLNSPPKKYYLFEEKKGLENCEKGVKMEDFLEDLTLNSTVFLDIFLEYDSEYTLYTLTSTSTFRTANRLSKHNLDTVRIHNINISRDEDSYEDLFLYEAITKTKNSRSSFVIDHLFETPEGRKDIRDMIMDVKIIKNKMGDLTYNQKEGIEMYATLIIDRITREALPEFINSIYLIIMLSKRYQNIRDNPISVNNALIYCSDITGTFFRLFMSSHKSDGVISYKNCVSMKKFKYPLPSEVGYLFGLAFE